MNSTKSRTRSNAAQMIETPSPSQLLTNISATIATSNVIQQQQYVPSLLKIESVVPTRNVTRNTQQQKATRLMTRSYSTLGPTSLAAAAAATPATYANGLASYRNATRKTNANLYRHKNNYQNFQQQPNLNDRHDSPTTGKTNGQQTYDSINIVVENGIHKVRRTAREREKQPDRINLDKRGLCSIPIIDNEPSLRLLSLQHNLINSLHIPENDVSLELSSIDGNRDSNNNNVPFRDGEKMNSTINQITYNGKAIATNSTPATSVKPLLRQKSRNQINLNFSANSNTMITNLGNNVNGGMKTATPATPSTSFLQKSFMFQGKSSILKRANSVMINYSPTQTPTGSSSTSIQSSIFGTIQRGKLMATPSFSIIDGSMHETTSAAATAANNTSNSNNNNNNNNNFMSKNTPDLQIDANNSYINSFRFNLSNLVFLDLYNNQIEKISNLDGLKSLTVLLLGKNRISDISGIVSLKETLRVLDLHGNRITHITQKICQLQELKSLNLAGNLLRQIQPNDFAGLCCLKELNLKRNRIKKINVSDDLHNLERLWLCHNELQNIEDMSSIAKSINLKEITIENNPISLAGDCVSFLVSYLPLLVSLNQLQITEQVRRAAHAWRKSKENTDQNYKHLSSDVNSNIRREEIISNARTNWELIRSQQANIINGSQRQANAPKKTNKSKLFSNNSSSSVSTGSFSSNNNPENSSTNCTTNIESNTKILRNVVDVQNHQISKLIRSTSHDSSQSFALEDKHDSPLITDQLIEMPKIHNNNNRSASSTRPQVDSESDFIGSDSDEPKSFKSRVPTTPPINSTTINSKPPSPIVIEVNESDDGNYEKNFTPPLPPITMNSNFDSTSKSEIAVSSSSYCSQNIKPHTLNEDPDEKPVKDVHNSVPSTARSPSPVVVKERATLTIIDIDNTIVHPNNVDSDSSHRLREKSELVDVEQSNLKAIEQTPTSPADDPQQQAQLQQQQQQRQVHSSQNNHHPRNRSSTRKIGPPLVRSQTARNLSSHLNQAAGSSALAGNLQQAPTAKKEPRKEIDKDREQGGDYLVEILGRYLNVYGVGAIKFVDKQWNTQKAHDVHTVKFSYINFNSISPILSRIKIRFPNIENYVFRETNIVCLGQLNAMADTQGLKSITIDPEGNQLVASNKKWRAYAIWRLNHWGLKQINGLEITDEEIMEADSIYNGLSDLVLWSLPEALLNPLFTRLRVEEMIVNSKITPKEWLLRQADESIRLVVGKEALQWKKQNVGQQQDEVAIRRKGKMYFGHIMENTVNAVEKLQKLEYLWPNILLEMIRNTLIDYSQIDLYIRNLMNEINSAS